jgi:fatty-acid desaturase
VMEMAVAAAAPILGIHNLQPSVGGNELTRMETTSVQAAEAVCLSALKSATKSSCATGKSVQFKLPKESSTKVLRSSRRSNEFVAEGEAPDRVTESQQESEPSDSTAAAAQPEYIWMSNVEVKRTRPSSFNRRWSSKDIYIAGFMTFMHTMCLLAPFTFSWSAVRLCVALSFITGMFGITLSFHRNLSHKSFKLPKWLEYTFAYCGVQAVQGDPLDWVSLHRYHHQYCDTEMDPHTPHEGFWHSHIGWLFDEKPRRSLGRANVGDMEKDDFYQFLHKTYIIHPVLLSLALYALGGAPYLVWGMAVRLVLVYHVTWFVNSASHVWGTQPWNTGDLSKNNWWVAMVAFGEGWHNNHHAFEYSARHGLKWWQLDPTWWTILGLGAIGLATKIKLPRPEHMKRLATKSS